MDRREWKLGTPDPSLLHHSVDFDPSLPFKALLRDQLSPPKHNLHQSQILHNPRSLTGAGVSSQEFSAREKLNYRSLAHEERSTNFQSTNSRNELGETKTKLINQYMSLDRKFNQSFICNSVLPQNQFTAKKRLRKEPFGNPQNRRYLQQNRELMQIQN